MNLYKLEREYNGNIKKDMYVEAIVCAHSHNDAKKIHPNIQDGVYWNAEHQSFFAMLLDGTVYLYEDKDGYWTNDLSKIKSKCIGKALPSIKRGCLCKYFYPGKLLYG